MLSYTSSDLFNLINKKTTTASSNANASTTTTATPNVNTTRSNDGNIIISSSEFTTIVSSPSTTVESSSSSTTSSSKLSQQQRQYQVQQQQQKPPPPPPPPLQQQRQQQSQSTRSVHRINHEEQQQQDNNKNNNNGDIYSNNNKDLPKQQPKPSSSEQQESSIPIASSLKARSIVDKTSRGKIPATSLLSSTDTSSPSSSSSSLSLLLSQQQPQKQHERSNLSNQTTTTTTTKSTPTRINNHHNYVGQQQYFKNATTTKTNSFTTKKKKMELTIQTTQLPTPTYPSTSSSSPNITKRRIQWIGSGIVLLTIAVFTNIRMSVKSDLLTHSSFSIKNKNRYDEIDLPLLARQRLIPFLHHETATTRTTDVMHKKKRQEQQHQQVTTEQRRNRPLTTPNTSMRTASPETKTVTTNGDKSKRQNSKQQQAQDSNLLVQKDDYIYSDGWDTAPIVIEEYKLIFFTVPKVACTTWKQAFRRMKFIDRWRVQDPVLGLPHNPKTNGLKYLNQYTIQEANELMTNPDYIRAIFVRDPKERFLSAFLDKALSDSGKHVMKRCCGGGGGNKLNSIDDLSLRCLKNAQTIEGFLELISQSSCTDPHWDPQHDRIESKYWSTINFVGHFDTQAYDAKRLLTKIGAWERIGKYGWGPYGNTSIFEKTKGSNTNRHSTGAASIIEQWYTPQLERKVEEFYSDDYKSTIFNFTKTILSTNTTTSIHAKRRQKRRKKQNDSTGIRRSQSYNNNDNERNRRIIHMNYSEQEEEKEDIKHNRVQEDDPFDINPFLLMEKQQEGDDASFSDEMIEEDTEEEEEEQQQQQQQQQQLLVQEDDMIYSKEYNKDQWDVSPIVIEKYKLVFFTVPKNAATLWKRLFRRIEGYDNWNTISPSLPHDPKKNGLTYLYDYPISKANEIMTSPDYTRAIFVRNPKERFLSVFLEKALKNNNNIIKKCCSNITTDENDDVSTTIERLNNNSNSTSCHEKLKTITGFLEIMKTCESIQWNPQIERMESKYWPYINFVGHIENLHHDGKQLLTKLGLWDTYGTSGWGSTKSTKGNTNKQKQQSISTITMFEDMDGKIISLSTVDIHGRRKQQLSKLWTWFTPELERLVDEFYSMDYTNPYLELQDGQNTTITSWTKTTSK